MIGFSNKFGILVFVISFSYCIDAQTAFVAVHASTGEVVINERGDHLLVPASIQKVILAGLALSELGPDHRFETVIAYTGNIDNQGVLEGDLIVQGGGDPTLASKYDQRSSLEVMNDIVTRVAKAGITCVEGSLVIDASIWGTESVAPTWPWYDLGNYYAAGAWGVNYMDNANELMFDLSNSVNTGPELLSFTGPESSKFINELVSGPKGSGDQAYIFGAPFQQRRFIRGSLPMGDGQFRIKGSLPEPPKFFADCLYEELNQTGIQIQNSSKIVYSSTVPHKDLHRLFVFKSSKLIDILRVMLLKSDNVYAEAVFRTLSKSKSYENALSDYNDMVDDLGFVHSIFYDGCGLSPFNRLSAMELASYLNYIINNVPDLLTILPSVEATSWSPYFSDKAIKVKSGYMEGVRGYCGVVNSEMVFVALYNGPDFGKAEIKKKLAEFLHKALND